MMRAFGHLFFVSYLLYFIQHVNCLIQNPGIGILADTNIYIARIKEFDSSYDEKYLIYRHNDPVYHLRSFTANNLFNTIYVCTPSTIYSLDLRLGSPLLPLLPIDDTPCRSSLTYLPDKGTLFWALFHSVIKFDFDTFSKEYIWNSTFTITDITYNDTTNYNFYISIRLADHESSILRCKSNGRSRFSSIQSCSFLDNGYREISALTIDNNILYVADRIAQKIYALTLLPSGAILSKDVLPLNTSTVADIQSMFIYNNYLVWLTRNGHVRLVSLVTFETRNLFWLDDPLQTIRLVSPVQWPNRTTTSTTSTTTHKITTTKTDTTSKTTTETTESTTKANDDDNYNPWKATTYVTSVVLGVALFLCGAMITCILLNYRLGNTVPHSFVNIFHILRRRTTTTHSTSILADDSLA